MQWIFDNLQIVAIVAAAIATLISRAKQAREDKEISENMPPAIPVDPDAELRRIREEVARRRAEREGRPVQPVPTEEPPPPLLSDDQDEGRVPSPWTQPEPETKPAPAPVLRTPPPIPNQDREDEVLERQRALAEKLRQLREEREAAAASARALSHGAVTAAYAQAGQSVNVGLPFSPSTLAADLRKPGEIRRAILLNEILGRPKGA